MEAVFLDRDGVINEESGYASNPKNLRLIPGSAEAIASLNARKTLVIVVSNQAGVARGYHTEEDVEIFHKAISKELKKVGAHIDRFYYCPHHREGQGEYGIECACRKPKPGLLLRAAKDMSLDLSRCVIIGDKASDISAGRAVGALTILVLTGHGANERASWNESFEPSYIARDLQSAVQQLLDHDS